MKFYRPLVMKISQVFDNGIIDLYYPSFFNKRTRKRTYFGDKNNIVRFAKFEEAKAWLERKIK